MLRTQHTRVHQTYDTPESFVLQVGITLRGTDIFVRQRYTKRLKRHTGVHSKRREAGEELLHAQIFDLSCRDQIRNQRLFELGYNVMRFWVYEVRDDLEGCLRRLKDWRENNATE